MGQTKSLRLCVDRVVPLEHKVEAAKLAAAENPANQPRLPRRLAGASFHPLKMALLTGKKWQRGRALSVAFLDGSRTQRAKVRQFAAEWCRYANIAFTFGGGAQSDLRISFEADDGSWSAVGTDCRVRREFPLDEPTMNFGWLRDDTEDTEWRRVVLHEFGHALGAIHEHQSPVGGIKWNCDAVYAYFSGPPNNWSKEQIDFNILQKYSVDQLNATKFDPLSIMLYEFPPELIVGGKGTHGNTKLSQADKAFIRRMYPKASG